MEEGSESSGILLPHRLVDELQRAATEANKPSLMGGDFARLAQSCQEVRSFIRRIPTLRQYVCGVCVRPTTMGSGYVRLAHSHQQLWHAPQESTLPGGTRASSDACP